MDNAPAWLPDPNGRHDHRYWDGSAWTDNVADAGVAGIDPYVPDLTPAEAPPPAEEPTVTDLPTVDEAPTLVDVPAAPGPVVPDATAAWPTSPARPAPPPPYVPAGPAAAPGGDSKGSKKALFIGGGILAAVVAAVAAVALGGGDDDGSDLRAQLASKFRSESEGTLSESDARCVADVYVDELGADAFDGIDLSDPDADPPADLEEEFGRVGFQAVEECDIDLAALGGSPDETTTTEATSETTDTTEDGSDGGTYGSDPELDALYDDCADGDFAACDELYTTSPIGSEYEEFGDSCGDRNEPQGFCVDLYENGGPTETTALDELGAGFEDILADTYEAQFNLDRDQAECLARAISGAIESGDLDEEAAFTDFMSFLTDCDISLEDISGT